MGLFNRPYFMQYSPHSHPDIVHSSMCDSAEDMKRIYDLHKDKCKITVWELVELEKDEIEEILDGCC